MPFTCQLTNDVPTNSGITSKQIYARNCLSTESLESMQSNASNATSDHADLLFDDYVQKGEAIHTAPLMG